MYRNTEYVSYICNYYIYIIVWYEYVLKANVSYHMIDDRHMTMIPKMAADIGDAETNASWLAFRGMTMIQWCCSSLLANQHKCHWSKMPPGGDELNVAVALSLLGVKSKWVSDSVADSSILVFWIWSWSMPKLHCWRCVTKQLFVPSFLALRFQVLPRCCAQRQDVSL